jgi:hypothetical protein
MRVNLYSQELTNECELTSKEWINSQGERASFYGIRLFLRSPEELHFTETDDDRSAVTIWLPRPDEPMAKGITETLGDMARMVAAHYDAAGGL